MAFSAFHADNNGASPGNLTSNTLTQLTFSRTTLNVGSNFASNAWVPPAGKIRIGGVFRATSATMPNRDITTTAIYKNGVLWTQLDGWTESAGADTGVFGLQADDNANGTDSYTLYALALASPTPPAISGAVIDTNFWGYATGSSVGFRANNNGSSQTVPRNVYTTLTLGNTDYNDGSHFASNTWTPPAGKVAMIAEAWWTNNDGVDPNNNFVAIFKNGSLLYHASVGQVQNGNEANTQIIVADDANGSDAYTFRVKPSDFGIGTNTVSGTNSFTYFSGYVLP
jgi:hypothetical protein